MTGPRRLAGGLARVLAPCALGLAVLLAGPPPAAASVATTSHLTTELGAGDVVLAVAVAPQAPSSPAAPTAPADPDGGHTCHVEVAEALLDRPTLRIEDPVPGQHVDREAMAGHASISSSWR